MAILAQGFQQSKLRQIGAEWLKLHQWWSSRYRRSPTESFC